MNPIVNGLAWCITLHGMDRDSRVVMTMAPIPGQGEESSFCGFFSLIHKHVIINIYCNNHTRKPWESISNMIALKFAIGNYRGQQSCFNYSMFLLVIERIKMTD